MVKLKYSAGTDSCARVGREPTGNAAKIWITKAGKCYLCHNNSQIPARILRNIMDIIEARSEEVIDKWVNYFGKIEYYC